MKFRFFALLLALSFVVWAQDNPAPSVPGAAPAPEAKSCCHRAADAKDGKSCCHPSSSDAKDAVACCGGKDKCEMKNGKMKDGQSCCDGKAMKAQMKQCKKNGGWADGKCCGAAADASAINCCGNKCERRAHASAS